MNKLKLIDEKRKTLRELDCLLQEKKQVVKYNYYLAQGHFKPDSIVRHPLRKSKPRVCNAVALPVRYDNDWNVTHVLCWVPQSDIARWLNMKTGRFDMKDLEGIPPRLHLDVRQEMEVLNGRRESL